MIRATVCLAGATRLAGQDRHGTAPRPYPPGRQASHHHRPHPLIFDIDRELRKQYIVHVVRYAMQYVVRWWGGLSAPLPTLDSGIYYHPAPCSAGCGCGYRLVERNAFSQL